MRNSGIKFITGLDKLVTGLSSLNQTFYLLEGSIAGLDLRSGQFSYSSEGERERRGKERERTEREKEGEKE